MDKVFLQGFLGWVLVIGLACTPAIFIKDKPVTKAQVEPVVKEVKRLAFSKVPVQGDTILISATCQTLEGLHILKPYIDNIKLDEARTRYIEIINTGEIGCFDMSLFFPDLATEVTLDKLIAQTYIGDLRIVQYWEASFPDGLVAYTWFEIPAKEI